MGVGVKGPMVGYQVLERRETQSWSDGDAGAVIDGVDLSTIPYETVTTNYHTHTARATPIVKPKHIELKDEPPAIPGQKQEKQQQQKQQQQ